MSEPTQAEVMRRVSESLDRIVQHPSPFGPDVGLTENGRTLLAGAAVGIRTATAVGDAPRS